MKVIISRPIPDLAIQLIEQSGGQAEILSKPLNINTPGLKNADALITMLSDCIDEAFLKTHSHLKCIANYAVGFNNIDVKTANELGIKIGNTPNVLTHATAELAFGLLHCVARNIIPANQNANNGEWKSWEPLGFLGTSLQTKTIGIYGMGRIGAELAKMCFNAYKMSIIYTARQRKTQMERDFFAEKCSFEKLCQWSDIISIHCPLSEETREVFNQEAFQKMQKKPIIINTARGEIIHQPSLVEALKSGWIRGAGLDVTTPEPLPPSHELFQFKNVVITPHIGSATQKAREDMAELAAKNVIAAIEGKPMPAPVLLTNSQ